MRLPLISKFRREDFPDAPSWIDRMFFILNQFMDSIYAGLKNNITFQDNIACQIKPLTFSVGSTGVLPKLQFAYTLNSKPIGVLLLQLTNTTTNALINTPISIQWSQGKGSVSIDKITGIEANNSYSVTLLVI